MGNRQPSTRLATCTELFVHDCTAIAKHDIEAEKKQAKALTIKNGKSPVATKQHVKDANLPALTDKLSSAEPSLDEDDLKEGSRTSHRVLYKNLSGSLDRDARVDLVSMRCDETDDRDDCNAQND